MGYRCTICSNDRGGHELPQWFKEKYQNHFLMPYGLTVYTKNERKFYDNEFFEDYQKAMIESGFFHSEYTKMHLAVLGEDGAIFRVVINKDKINYDYLDDYLTTAGILTYMK
jgi:hypothetical protein